MPVGLGLGLALSVWAGVFMMQGAIQNWHHKLYAYADDITHQTSARWWGLNGYFSGFADLLHQNPNLPAAEFRQTAQYLQKNYPEVKLMAFVPAPAFMTTRPTQVVESETAAFFPARGEIIKENVAEFNAAVMNNMPAVAIGKRAQQHAAILPDSANVSLLPLLKDVSGTEVFIMLPISTLKNPGWLLAMVDIRKFANTALKNRKEISQTAGLFLSITDTRKQPLLARTLIERQPTSFWPLQTEYEQNLKWGYVDWVFRWRFDKTSLGGPSWLSGFVTMVLGLFFTAVMGWILWSQHAMGAEIRNQVILRTNRLEQTSRRFRLITDNAYDLIATVDPEGIVDYVNSAYHRVLEYTKEDLKDTNLLRHVHPRDVDIVSRMLRDVVQGRKTPEITFRMRHKKGHWVYLEGVGKGLHNEQWQLTHIVVHCRDVTSRKVYADELARSEQRFRDFADSSADWLWEIDSKLEFAYISPGVKFVLGYEPEEMIAKMRFDDLFEEEEDPTHELISNRIQQHQPYRDVEFWTRSRNGERVCLRMSGVPVFDEKQRFTGFRGASSNVTSTKLSQENIFRMATTDSLTNLLNRNRFVEELEHTVNLAKRHNTQGVLLFIDLDRFKEVNDTHGHDAGDILLKAIAETLIDSVRNTDIVARLGGDEFAVIMHDIEAERAKTKVEEIIANINALEVNYNGNKISTSMSIGMVPFPQEGKSGADLVMNADLAMYRAKDMGRNRLFVDHEGTSTEGTESVREQLKWVDLLRKALDNGEFEMHFQPLIPSSPKNPLMYEALIRIRDENGQIGSPVMFIDAAEHFGLIQQLDLSVVERCMETHVAIKKKHGIEIGLSINLSGRSIGDQEIIRRLEDLTHKYKINPSCFMFEVTETSALHNPSAIQDIEKIKKFVDGLREMGFKFALDDFGSGFSSFSYLRTLNVDCVKIDGRFVKDLATSQKDRLFVSAMTDITKGLGIVTIAEFVEDEQIVEILEEIGVDYGQGFHLGKPTADLVDLNEHIKDMHMKDFAVPKSELPHLHMQPTTAAPKAPSKKKGVKKTQKKKA